MKKWGKAVLFFFSLLFSLTACTAPQKNDEVNLSIQRIGSADYGYMDIPEDWVPFQEIDGGDNLLQFCTIDATTILTLSNYSTNNQTVTAELMASAIQQSLEKNPDTTKVELTTVTFAGYDAEQLYATYNDDSVLAIWLFEAEDDKVHYVALEGTKEDVMDITELVQNSYSFSE